MSALCMGLHILEKVEDRYRKMSNVRDKTRGRLPIG